MGRCEEAVHCNKMHMVAFQAYLLQFVTFYDFFFFLFSAFSFIASVKVNDDYHFPL